MNKQETTDLDPLNNLVIALLFAGVLFGIVMVLFWTGTDYVLNFLGYQPLSTFDKVVGSVSWFVVMFVIHPWVTMDRFTY